MTLLEPIELRARGFDALVQGLGWVEAVRFLQQFERSTLNYTLERDRILGDADAAEIVARLRAFEARSTSSASDVSEPGSPPG